MTETPLSRGSLSRPPQAREAPEAAQAPGFNAAEAPAATGSHQLFPWWLSGILGVVSILFGVAVLAWPDETLRVMAVFVGIWLLLGGIARVIGAFVSGRGLGSQVLSGIVGLLFLALGVACLRNLVTGVAVMGTIVALVWLFGGLTQVVAGLIVTGPTRRWLLLLGGFSTLVGIAFLVWPGLSLASLLIATSIGAFVVGAGELAYAYAARKLSTAR